MEALVKLPEAAMSTAVDAAVYTSWAAASAGVTPAGRGDLAVRLWVLCRTSAMVPRVEEVAAAGEAAAVALPVLSSSSSSSPSSFARKSAILPCARADLGSVAWRSTSSTTSFGPVKVTWNKGSSPSSSSASPLLRRDARCLTETLCMKNAGNCFTAVTCSVCPAMPSASTHATTNTWEKLDGSGPYTSNFPTAPWASGLVW
mmetsp:Transcript_19965/g.48641  ORF Transcript_19965/g.48641 Transcript_19965/m.48641 type:complete len:202 (+) Transcript_19965:389-994(+)